VAWAGSYVYVADTENDRIEMWLPSLEVQFVHEWGGHGTEPGTFDRPTDVTVKHWTEEVYVVDSGNNRIQVFNSAGVFLRMWGKTGSGPGEFLAPHSIAVGDSSVYVSDRGNHRIQRFSHAGEFRGAWGVEGSSTGGFVEAAGISVSCGEVFVVDQALGRVQVFAGDGRFLRAFGSSGSAAGQISNPSGIASDCGSVVVADTGNNRLAEFSDSGVGHCYRSGHAFTDVTPRLGWTVYAVDEVNSQLIAIWFPDPVVPATWGEIKARFRE
jgi:DNA-binding beta-propeller fold protein YncE